MKIKTHAFVLKTTIFKESSLIIRLFTREKGKSTYIVKAAMRQKSPNKAIYQQLNEVEIDYSHHPKKQNRISACITFLFLVTLRRILTWFNPEWDDLSRED